VRIGRVLMLSAVVVSGCGATGGATTSAGASVAEPSLVPSSAAVDASAPPSTIPATLDPRTTATPSGLHPFGFARITIPELNVRTGPSLSAAQAMEPVPDGEALPIRWGTKSAVDDVFVLEGPIDADGYHWWKVAPTEYANETDLAGVIHTLPSPYVQWDPGWVAAGGGDLAWLVPTDGQCPAAPVEVVDLTIDHASWAIGLGCLQGQILTLRGWRAGGGMSTIGSLSVFATKRTWESDTHNTDRLDFKVFPETLPLPAPDQWWELVGQFDHPSCTSATGDAGFVLQCRSTFVATSVRGVGLQ
jgi:hypothetical protein